MDKKTQTRNSSYNFSFAFSSFSLNNKEHKHCWNPYCWRFCKPKKENFQNTNSNPGNLRKKRPKKTLPPPPQKNALLLEYWRTTVLQKHKMITECAKIALKTTKCRLKTNLAQIITPTWPRPVLVNVCSMFVSTPGLVVCYSPFR